MKRCMECKHWGPEPPEDRFGYCSRYPPTPPSYPSPSGLGIWPKTHLNDLCGEFKRAAKPHKTHDDEQWTQAGKPFVRGEPNPNSQ